MSAELRLLALTLVVGLLAASCGQKGPLRLPEESGAAASTVIGAPTPDR